MLLVVITFLLVAVGVISYWYGAWKLSRYAARISGGLGISVLLIPPVTFWFAFFKLEQEGKEFPTTMWLFGIVSTTLMTIVFWTPISLVLTGRMDELEKPSGVAATAVAEYGIKPGEENVTATPSPAPEPTPTPANVAGGTNNAGTNGAAGTNNAANTNNGVAATAGAAGSTGGAAQ